MLDDKIKAVYKWVHQNHDPSCVEDLAESRLPVEVRSWIVSHVKNNLDWKAIKFLLRLDLSVLKSVRSSTLYYQI